VTQPFVGEESRSGSRALIVHTLSSTVMIRRRRSAIIRQRRNSTRRIDRGPRPFASIRDRLRKWVESTFGLERFKRHVSSNFLQPSSAPFRLPFAFFRGCPISPNGSLTIVAALVDRQLSRKVNDFKPRRSLEER